MFSLRPLPGTLTGKEPFYLIATWFHSGRIRPVSGTWGSLAAWPFLYFIKMLGGNTAVLITALVAFAAGLWALERYLKHSKQPDPSEVVIDEVIGMAILWLAIPVHSFFYALLGFAIFRVCDAVKRGPVGWCDKNIKGALGILVDDVVAGIMAAIAVWVLLYLF